MTETCAELGESPVWRAEDDMIWWVDVEGLRLLRTDARGRTRAHTGRCAPAAKLRCSAAGHNTTRGCEP